MFLKVVFFDGNSGIKISLKLLIGNLVIRLKLMIIWETFLNCVIGEMDFWLEGMNIELVGRCANISLLIPVGPGDSKEVGDHHIVANIELPVVVKQGTVDVHLNYVGAFLLLLLTVAPSSLALLQQRI